MINELVYPNSPKLVSAEGNTAVFEIVPLYPGYGTTIGNLLRRVLLSSIPGWGITKVKIENVLHEFANLPGVLEDILDLTLNLKQLRVGYTGSAEVELTLEAKGKKEVRAGEIKGPNNMVIANPDLVIATLTTDKAELKMRLTAEPGLGYSRAEDREEREVEPGLIVLDAIFSPIRNVSFELDEIKVGKRTDFNLLRLAIESDGTITPTAAMVQAIEIISKHLNIINEASASD